MPQTKRYYMDFPFRLHGILQDAEHNETLSRIVSWLPCGKAFQIRDKTLFQQVVLTSPRYFQRPLQWRSFQILLNGYSFDRMDPKSTSSTNKFGGIYHHRHALFQRDNVPLCKDMTINRKQKTKMQNKESNTTGNNKGTLITHQSSFNMTTTTQTTTTTTTTNDRDVKELELSHSSSSSSRPSLPCLPSSISTAESSTTILPQEGIPYHHNNNNNNNDINNNNNYKNKKQNNSVQENEEAITYTDNDETGRYDNNNNNNNNKNKRNNAANMTKDRQNGLVFVGSKNNNSHNHGKHTISNNEPEPEPEPILEEENSIIGNEKNDHPQFRSVDNEEDSREIILMTVMEKETEWNHPYHSKNVNDTNWTPTRENHNDASNIIIYNHPVVEIHHHHHHQHYYYHHHHHHHHHHYYYYYQDNNNNNTNSHAGNTMMHPNHHSSLFLEKLAQDNTILFGMGRAKSCPHRRRHRRDSGF